MRTLCVFLALHLTMVQLRADEPLKIGVLIYDGLAISEITAPVEVFFDFGEEKQFDVLLIGETNKPITSHEGMQVLPNTTFEKSPQLDVVIVPGSYKPEAGEKNPKVHAFIQKQAKKAKYVASHCAGAFVLGNAGLLDGKKATTYYGGQELLAQQFPKAKVQDISHHYVVDGNLITSNGALISYEASLWLLEKLAGPERAKATAERLYYDRLFEK